MTVAKLLKKIKDEKERGIYIVKDDAVHTFMSYGSLYQKANQVLAGFRYYGIKQKDEVVIMLNDNEQFIITLWAAFLGGIIPIPIFADYQNIEHVSYHKKVYQHAHIVVAGEHYETMKHKLENVLEYQMLCINEVVDEEVDVNEEVDQDQVALIQFSSGSYSNPKGIRLSNKNILYNLYAIQKYVNIKKDDVFVSWLPLVHNMGLVYYHMMPIMQNINQVSIQTTSFIKQPQIWLDAITKYNATITGTNNTYLNFITRYIATTKSEEWNLSNLRMISIGSELISNKACDEFANKLEAYGFDKTALWPGYGMTEATLVVTLKERGKLYHSLSVDRNKLSIGDYVKIVDREDKSAEEFVSVGTLLDYLKINIRDNSNQILGEGYIGNIYLQGDSIAKDYYSIREDKFVLESLMKDEWLDTGDIGFIYNGELYIIGRSKDIIIHNGENYYSVELEKLIDQTLSRYCQHAKSIVFSAKVNQSYYAEEIICAIQGLDNITEIMLAINKVLIETYGLKIDKFLNIDKFPTTSLGKVKRLELREDYLRGRWKENICMLNIDEKVEPSKECTLQRVQKDILEIITKQVEEQIDLDESIFECCLDSSKMLQIYNQVDNKFPGIITIADLFEYVTPRLLAQFIYENLANN